MSAIHRHNVNKNIYFNKRILGALFAVLINSTPSVGASIAVYGLLGCYV